MIQSHQKEVEPSCCEKQERCRRASFNEHDQQPHKRCQPRPPANKVTSNSLYEALVNISGIVPQQPLRIISQDVAERPKSLFELTRPVLVGPSLGQFGIELSRNVKIIRI